MIVPKFLQPEYRVKLDSFEFAPLRVHSSDAGADLVTKEDVYLIKGVRQLVKTGVRVEIPLGHVGLLFPRSSLSKHNIIMTNSVGVIDSTYRGEIMASLMYIGDLPDFTIYKNERIVQLVIVPIVLPQFIPVDSLEDTDRGEGGFGSTGR